MSDGYLFEKLCVLNDVYSNTLVPTKQPIQASVIKTPLLPHQTTLLNGMYLYKERMVRGFLVKNQAINGKLGIIADGPGTGKTLTVLAYLAAQLPILPRLTAELSNNSSKYFFSHELYQLSDISSANLIIVPHSLFNHWRTEIATHTSMTYIPVESRRALKGAELAKSMVSSSFVLTTNKCYKYVREYAEQHGITWNNVFIDEAASIYINSSDPPLRFHFLWLITNSWIPLLFKNPTFTKSNLAYLKDRIQIHPELDNWLSDSTFNTYEGILFSSTYLKNYLPFYHSARGHIVLRNSTDFIQFSIQLPNMFLDTIHCRPNISLNSLMSYYLARGLEPNITTEKIPNMFQALGVQFSHLADYLSKQPEMKHNLIVRKAEESECVICLDKAESPTIVNCCYNLYCAKCLLKNMILNQKCPTCREVLGVKNLCCLKPLNQNEIINTRNKVEACFDLFEKNRDAHFIVYSSFDNIYYQLFEQIDRIGMKADRVDSNHFALLKTIKNFQDGVTNILFVSNVDLIRGFSLQNTSHLIFFHELPVQELRQVLIHSAQRIGRKQPLKIIQLNSEIVF